LTMLYEIVISRNWLRNKSLFHIHLAATQIQRIWRNLLIVIYKLWKDPILTNHLNPVIYLRTHTMAVAAMVIRLNGIRSRLPAMWKMVMSQRNLPVMPMLLYFITMKKKIHVMLIWKQLKNVVKKSEKHA